MNRSSEYLKWKKPNVDSIYGILPFKFRKKGLLIHIYLLYCIENTGRIHMKLLKGLLVEAK